ncbi:MAG: universal stress protein [Bdellovibrionaceae bacterium]|nr:universal stress protein [Pseudobdellovibrionaceae bacterium]
MKKKIIWAIDPYDENKRNLKKAYLIARRLAGGDEGIVPVFISSLTQPYYDFDFGVYAWVDKFAVHSTADFQKTLERQGLGMLAKNAIVEFTNSSSVTSTCKKLVKVSQNQKADCVLVFSHAKGATERFILGSFAETLVHYAKTPVLIVNPKNLNSKMQNILYCDDLEGNFIDHLEEVNDQLRILKAKELIYFHAPHPIYRFSMDENNKEARNYKSEVDKKLGSLEGAAKKGRLPFTPIVDAEWSSVPEKVVKYSKRKKADLIVVRAKSSRLGALVGGSVTRQLLRQSSVPLLVMKET